MATGTVGVSQSAHGEAAPLMLTTAQQRAVELGGTFRSVFDRTGFANCFPLLVWGLVVEFLGLAAMPLAYLLLPGLRDRGYLFSKTLGILLLAWLGWMSVSLGLARNDRGTALLSAGVVLALGLAAFAARRREILTFARRRLALLLAGEIIFWLAFAGFLAIRMSNPDLWHPVRGGEKPMDLAYLMATIKSVSFPPYDPWFAGGYLNYYYFGQVIVAFLIKLTGIVPTTAYNLVIPLLFGLTVSGAFSAGYSLAHRVIQAANRLAPVLSGTCAALFIAILGNLGGAIQVLHQLNGIESRLASPRDAPSAGLFIPGLGLWQALTGTHPLDIPSDWYWASTRVVEGTINEFPFFTFLYSDLHAHLIALPITMLAIGVAISLLGDGVNEWQSNHSADRCMTRPRSFAQFKAGSRPLPLGEGIPTILLGSLVLGALYTTNSWDFPTYSLIIAAALILPAIARSPSTGSVALALARTVAIVGVAYVLYLPFHQNFRSFYTGVEPFPDKTLLGSYLVVHGLFLFVLVSFLLSELLLRHERSKALRALSTLARWPRKVRRVIQLFVLLGNRRDLEWLGPLYELALVAGVAGLFYWIGLRLIALLFVLAVATLFCLSKRQATHGQFLVVLVGLGVALSAGVEFFAIQGDVGRMNTVFKFYFQIWVLWGVASAVAVPIVLGRLRSSFPRSIRTGWALLLVSLIIAAGVYPLVATRARVEDRFDRDVPSTLDGIAYMRTAEYFDQNRQIPLYGDYEAIKWIQDNVDGSPVILEAQAPIYHWGSRVSIYTGLPTVLGWDWHEKQQRWAYQSLVDQRAADVKAMYTAASIEERLILLRNYRVRYIYLGELERAYYPTTSLGLFDNMVGQFLEIVYDTGGVRIYRVKG